VTPAFPRRGIFPGCVPEFVRATGESNLYWRAYSRYVGSLAWGGDVGSPATAVAGGERPGPAPLPRVEAGRCQMDCCEAETDLAWCGGASGEADSVVSGEEQIAVISKQKRRGAMPNLNVQCDLDLIPGYGDAERGVHV